MIESVLEGVPDAMVVVGRDGRILHVNHLCTQMFGYAAGEMLGQPIHLLLPVRFRAPHAGHLDRYLAAPLTRPMGACADLLARRKDGSEFPVDVALGPVEATSGTLVAATIRDMSGRLAAAREADIAEKRLHELMKLAEVGTWELDLKTGKRVYSPELLALLGLEAAHDSDAAFFAAVHPDDRERVAAATAEAIATCGSYSLDLRLIGAEEERCFESRAFVVTGADGDPERLVGLAKDVTARRRAESEVRRSEARYRLLFEIAPDTIAILDASGRVELTNRPLPGQWPGQASASALDLADADARETLRGAMDAARATGEAVGFELRAAGREGLSRLWEGRIRLMDGEPGRSRFLLYASDVTEDKAAHARLMVSERMASVGMLAAGVAHEINNPLAAVITNLDFAVAELEAVPGDAVAGVLEALRDARAAADRAREVSGDLRVFSRGDDVERKPVYVNAVLESALRMAWNEIRHRARVVRSLREVPPVVATEGRLGQVFLNLLVNAAQAIPEGNVSGHEIAVSSHVNEQGRVVVAVRDTGPGMSEDVRARLFQPFFTTKPRGVGTGLGLSICHRLVTELQGEIEVDSAPGRGTTFRVILPAATAPAAAASAASVGPSATRRGRILVVDDEPIIATAIHRALWRDHDVTTAHGGREALELLRRGDRFDEILCDLMMPDLTGMDTHAELHRFAPEQAARMVFITGGAFTARAQTFLAEVPHARLDKPFSTDDLRNLVAELLRG
jgi:PAS domain S-box-containing protein